MENIELYFEKEKDPHHFLLVQGFLEQTQNYLLPILEKKYNASFGNGNLFIKNFEKFLVDDARQLSELSFRKNKLDQKNFYIISFSFFNQNAQNAMLKILEEPAIGSNYIFILPSFGNILDTIKSRSVLIDARHLYYKNDQVEKLLKMNFSDRTKWLNKILKDIENEKISKNFILDLNKNIIFELKNKKYPHKLIEKYIDISSFLNRPDVSFKNNLEALLYLLPIE